MGIQLAIDSFSRREKNQKAGKVSQQDSAEGERRDRRWTLLLFMFEKVQTSLLWGHGKWRLGRLKGTKQFYTRGLLKQGVKWLWGNSMSTIINRKKKHCWKESWKEKNYIREISAYKQIGFPTEAACEMPVHPLWPEVSDHPQVLPFLSAIYYAWFWEYDLIWLRARQHSIIHASAENLLLHRTD